ncbi:MAG TPA: hypothetical protein VIJ51_18610 [Solirubrobacteraceae bacterium]
MLSRLLRTLAILASLVLLASFALFAIDQAGGASDQAQAEVGASGAQVLGPPIKGPAAQTGVRGTIDSAARDLVSPFHAWAPGGADSWGSRIFDLGVGLLIYAVGLGALARTAGLARRPHVTRRGDQPLPRF